MVYRRGLVAGAERAIRVAGAGDFEVCGLTQKSDPGRQGLDSSVCHANITILTAPRPPPCHFSTIAAPL